MSKKPKKLEVHWEDSASDNGGWTDLNEHKPKTIMAYSIGYLHERNNKQLVLTPHRTETNQALGTIAIPTSAIRKIRKLK